MILALLACGSSGTEGATGLQVQLHAGTGVTQAERAGSLLEQALRARGIEARVLAPVVKLEERSLVGVRPGEGDELAPLKAFVRGHAAKGDTVHLVVLEEVVDVRSPLARSLRLDGIGLSVEGASTPAAKQLMTEIGPCAPVLLVDQDALDASLLLHELGHALGLPHHADPTNLMHEQRGTRLTEKQLAAFR